MLNYPDMLIRTYSPVWNKYRPAILKLMIDALEKPQQYKLLENEFRALNAKQKGGYAFTLQVGNSRVLNNIKDSPVAQDLLEVLQVSKKATELMSEGSYEFIMDKQFMLHVTKLISQQPGN
jgi:hypothetical protein